MRLYLCLILGLHCAAASAAVSCEQLAEIAFTTQKLRDQGYALAAVLAEADKLESSNKFTAADIESIRIVVVQAFNNGGRFPYEVLQMCKDKLRK
jgi:hypothetical protein